MKLILIIFLLWFMPARAEPVSLSGPQLATVKIEKTATEFSARKRHRRHRAPQVQEFQWPWDQAEQAAPRVRTAHNRQAYKQRYRRGYVTQQAAAPVTFGSDLVARARSYLGTNPTGWRRLWCARFMAMIAPEAAKRVKNPDWARDWTAAGRRVSGPQIGAIAVMTRRGGGHVGVVSGVDAKGNPIIISGNHGHRVAESVYRASRVVAYVVPN